jgi:translation elongation factor P/translation initiation factor 5A
MVIASELKSGMVLRIEKEIYRVLEAEFKAGTAKLTGVVKVKLNNVTTGSMWEHHFRPQERISVQRCRQLHIHGPREFRAGGSSQRYRGSG